MLQEVLLLEVLLLEVTLQEVALLEVLLQEVLLLEVAFCELFQTLCIWSPPQKRISAAGSWAYMPFIRLEPCRSPDASPAMI